MIKALLTGAAAFSLAAAPVFADSVRTTSGSTAIKVNADVFTMLKDVNVQGTLTTLGAAKLGKTGILTLPISGGAVDLVDADGEILHTGGIKIARSVNGSLKTVVFTNFALEVKVSEPGVTPPVPATPTIQITAIASENGTLKIQDSFPAPAAPAPIPSPIPQYRIAVFTLTLPSTPLALNKSKKLVINGGALALATPAREMLNRALGLPSVTIPAPDPPAPSFTDGMVIGSTSLFQATTKKL